MNKYRNKFEERTGRALDNVGAEFSYETLKLEYFVESEYIPDFVIKTPSGAQRIVETKGNGRSFDHHTRRKMIAVKQQHPELDIRILFYSDGKIGPKRKDGTFMLQSDWAKKHGFIYAIKDIPKEWLI